MSRKKWVDQPGERFNSQVMCARLKDRLRLRDRFNLQPRQ